MSRLIFIFFAAGFLAVNCGKAPSDSGTKRADASGKKGKVKGEPVKNDPADGELERIEKEALLAFTSRDWDASRRLIAKGLGLAGDKGGDLEIKRAELLLMLGDVERETGRETEARRQYTDAMAIFHVRKNVKGSFMTYLSTGEIELQKGDYAAAARQFSSAEQLAGQLKENSPVGFLRLYKGRLASRQVKPEDAKAEFLEAIKIFEAERDKKNTAETLLLLAAEEDALGWAGACQNHVDKATALFRDLGDLDGEARALHRLAGYAERDGNYGKAKQLLQKVEELYKKLDRTSQATSVRQHIDSLPDAE